MAITIRSVPISEADRLAMADLGVGGSPGFIAPVVLLVLGSAAAALAFRVIATHALPAMALLLGGISAAVIGLGMLLVGLYTELAMWGSRRSVLAAGERGTVEEIVLRADAAWLADSVDEDAGAVLLRVAADRFVYFNAPWVDDQDPRHTENPGQTALTPDFPSAWTIRRLAGPGAWVLSASPGPDRLEMNQLPDLPAGMPSLVVHAGSGSCEVLVLDAGMLPEEWRSAITPAATV